MLVSQRLAIAAHLHVLLRRKTGRVTDTEWMAVNVDYALEIVRFTRQKAVEDKHPDLLEWADKLERAIAEPVPANRPLAQAAMQILREKAQASAPAAPLPASSVAALAPSEGFARPGFVDTGFAESSLEPGKAAKPRDPDAPRYVGGIR